jgi:hypothetical protein
MKLFRLSIFIAVCIASGWAISDIGPAVIQATSIELGDAGTTDTTITRASAGVINVEGAPISGFDGSSALTVTGSMTFDADALHIFDTNASHDLIITPGSDLAADRVLTLTTGDAARTITLSGDPTLSDWFDQSVKAAASPTFANPTLTTIELGAAATDATFARTGAGEATLEGDAIKHAGKQMLYIPASAMKNTATSPASCGDTYDSGAGDVTFSVCAFDTGATEERADFQIALPKSWNEGTLTFIPISTCTGCSASQTIQYELGCGAISHDDPTDATIGTRQTSSVTVTAANDSLVGAESSAITCGGTPAENDLIAFRVSRDTSVDNGAGDALLIGLKVFWTDNASTLAE